MAMEHKAYLFDFAAFQSDLKPVIERALQSDEWGEIAAFIKENQRSCKDPYEGLPLDEGWEDALQERDVQLYGDIALTKFYEPSQDKGLGQDWLRVEQALLEETGSPQALLGHPVGSGEILFDPGRMGAYFQSESDVAANFRTIEQLRSADLKPLVDLLRVASFAGSGLYVTF